MKRKILTKTEEHFLIKRAKLGDREAVNRLVSAHYGFIVSVANKLPKFNSPDEDVVNEGIFGFIKAIHKFDENKNVRFLSYAIHWMLSYMRLYISNNSSIVRVPPSWHKKFKKIPKYVWNPIIISVDGIESESRDSIYGHIEPDYYDHVNFDKKIATLPPQHQIVINKRFGFKNQTQQTLKEIGNEFGVSKERIRQIQIESLKKLKETLAA